MIGQQSSAMKQKAQIIVRLLVKKLSSNIAAAIADNAEVAARGCSNIPATLRVPMAQRREHERERPPATSSLLQHCCRRIGRRRSARTARLPLLLVEGSPGTPQPGQKGGALCSFAENGGEECHVGAPLTPHVYAQHHTDGHDKKENTHTTPHAHGHGRVGDAARANGPTKGA